MDEWQPITEKELLKLLSEEKKLFTANAVKVYEKYKVKPYKVKIVRSEMYGTEEVWVVAKDGNMVVWYCDVEEDFGWAFVDVKGFIEEEGGGLVGNLGWVLTATEFGK